MIPHCPPSSTTRITLSLKRDSLFHLCRDLGVSYQPRQTFVNPSPRYDDDTALPHLLLSLPDLIIIWWCVSCLPSTSLELDRSPRVMSRRLERQVRQRVDGKRVRDGRLCKPRWQRVLWSPSRRAGTVLEEGETPREHWGRS